MRPTFAILLLCACLHAQPVCEDSAEAKQAFEEYLQAARKNPELRSESGGQRVYGELARRFPDDIDTQERYLSSLQWSGNPMAAQRKRLLEAAEKRPQDAAALHLAAYSLFRYDTPQAIALHEKALKAAPDYPPSLLRLAEIYTTGRFEDKQKAAGLLERYFRACPGTGYGQWTLSKLDAPELTRKASAALRARLERETDPKKMRDWPTVWGNEFRSRPVAEHDAVRKQVAADLARLEKVKGDEEWLDILIRGAKQAAAPPAKITALEDRMMSEFPESRQAYGIAYNRWKKANPEPENAADAAAWKAYHARRREFLKSAVAQFTEVSYLPGQLEDLELEHGGVSPEKASALIEASLERDRRESDGSFYAPFVAAQKFLDRRIRPERAMELLADARPHIGRAIFPRISDDTLTDKERQESEKSLRRWQSGWASTMLEAAVQANRKDALERVKDWMPASLPEEKNEQSGWWASRARIAALEGKPADALTFYQQALFTRTPPKPYQGKLSDPLMEEARLAFAKAGGSETAFAVWAKPPGEAPLKEGRWEKATKDLPAFSLEDLNGKTWKLTSLEGKAVLINVWATWCGPCRMELPKLQKLYEKVKDRTDLQILTFNIDEELGLVQPFVKEHAYTFPVLPAYAYVNQVLNMIGIPQNWLVDPKGKWQWTQLGFDAADADWVQTMTNKLESLKRGGGE